MLEKKEGRKVSMKKNGTKWKGYRTILCSMAMLLMLGMYAVTAKAYTSDNHPHAVFSEDGLAWSIVDQLPRDDVTAKEHSYWYPYGTEVYTGTRRENLRPGVGQHIYGYDRNGMVPIYKWEVRHRAAMCIHGTTDKTFHGLNTVQNICYMPYFSGWTPYCATCGRMLFSYGFLHYMSKESASTLDAYNMDKDYFYRCPYNGHLEQGFTPGTHACDAISYNRYKVVYKENGTSVTGRMNDSIHMYNNATEYEGVSVTPSRKLTVCAYVREGYEFAYWSTRPDGTGTRYTDGQEIYNLTAENYDKKDESKGVITLYAQWKRKTSSLVIDANGGTYRDDKGTVNTATHKTTFSNMPYGTSYTLDNLERISL